MLWTRTSQCCAAALLLAGLAIAAAVLNSAGAPSATAQEIAELKEQLKFGLLVARPEDKAFIDRVVVMVEEGKLSQDLVKGIFQWARTRKKPYPFPYFKRALQLRAAEMGVRIDVTETAG